MQELFSIANIFYFAFVGVLTLEFKVVFRELSDNKEIAGNRLAAVTGQLTEGLTKYLHYR